MRDYLQRLYGVDVLAVRSYVEQQRVTRLKPMGKWGYGKLRRPMSKKKMTVEMTQPFVWPEPPEELDAYVTFLSLIILCMWLCMANGIAGEQMGKRPILQSRAVPERNPGQESSRGRYGTRQGGTELVRKRG